MVLEFSMEVTTVPSATFASRIAHEIATVVNRAVKERGRCFIGFSGGSTPGPVYQALRQEQNIDWSRVTLCLVDDRYVSPTHAASNQLLLRRTLLDDLQCPSESIVPNTSLNIALCVAGYEDAISQALAAHGGHFDLLILGMGDDGHIASLFPPLTVGTLENTHLVLHTMTDRFEIADRISLSPAALKNAREAILLLSAKKESVLRVLQESTEGPERWPLKLLKDRTRIFLQS